MIIRDPKTKKGILPKAHPGYYPGFSTLEQKSHWDAATARTIDRRLKVKAELHFFSTAEAETLQAILNRVLPQDDRDEAHQIPLLRMIDERLYKKLFDGYIFEGSVEDDVAHRMGIQAIEKLSMGVFQKVFTELSTFDQESLLISLKEGKPGKTWACDSQLKPQHYWNLLVKDAVSAYYAHPLAWDEIGFGGPAYPRGYTRLTRGQPEPWEKDERRYEWEAPVETRSDRFEVNRKLFSGASDHDQLGND